MGNVSEIDSWLRLERASHGAIQMVTAGNYQLTIEHDLQGFPVRWVDSQEDWSIIRDVNGRIIEAKTPASLQVNRDPRGWINAIHFGEFDWRFLKTQAGTCLNPYFQTGTAMVLNMMTFSASIGYAIRTD